MTVPNRLENQSLQPLPLMLIFSTAWQRVHHLLHVSIFAITPQLTIRTDQEQVPKPSTWALAFRMHRTSAGSEKSQQEGAIVSCRPA